MSKKDVIKYEREFAKSCIQFLELAMICTGEIDEMDPIEKFNEFLDSIIGNRNKDTCGVYENIPQLYTKVIEYCNNACIISEQVEERKRNSES